MTGLRLDQASFSVTYVLWILVLAASLFTYGQTFVWGTLKQSTIEQAALVYATVVWALYYGGLSLVLGTGLRARLIKRWGEKSTRQGFSAVLGVVFLHQALAQGAIMECWQGTFAVRPGWLLYTSAMALVVLGLGVKLWATYASSLDTYYYIDMLIGRPLETDEEAITSGPFRWFNNPMYGVGNLQGYGSALLVASWPGLVVAGVYHASVYGFYYMFERPFVEATYGASETN